MHRHRNLGIAALLTIACVESPAIILGHAWAQTTPTAEVQQVKAEPERLTLACCRREVGWRLSRRVHRRALRGRRDPG
jgi:hypothetical protein